MNENEVTPQMVITGGTRAKHRYTHNCNLYLEIAPSSMHMGGSSVKSLSLVLGVDPEGLSRDELMVKGIQQGAITEVMGAIAGGGGSSVWFFMEDESTHYGKKRNHKIGLLQYTGKLVKFHRKEFDVLEKMTYVEFYKSYGQSELDKLSKAYAFMILNGLIEISVGLT